MEKFTVRMIDHTFVTETRLDEAQDASAAQQVGVQEALRVAADEMQSEVSATVMEVIVEDGAGKPLNKVAVSVSVAPLAVKPLSDGTIHEDADADDSTSQAPKSDFGR